LFSLEKLKNYSSSNGGEVGGLLKRLGHIDRGGVEGVCVERMMTRETENRMEDQQNQTLVNRVTKKLKRRSLNYQVKTLNNFFCQKKSKLTIYL